MTQLGQKVQFKLAFLIHGGNEFNNSTLQVKIHCDPGWIQVQYRAFVD